MEGQRVIIITGGLRGLGYTFAKRIISEGKLAKVVLTSTDRNQARNSDILNELKSLNTSVQVDHHVLNIDQEASRVKFVEWFVSTYKQVDVILNNAGYISLKIVGMQEHQASAQTPEVIAREVLNTNLFGLIHFTELLLPALTQDGKVINVSSLLGKLFFHEESLQKEFSDPSVTKDHVLQKANDLIQMRISGNLSGGWKEQQFGTVYHASKVLLNAYTRWHLSKNLPSPLQTALVIHPGWVQTDLGGPQAPLTPAQGIISMYRSVVELPYGKPEETNGIFLDEKGNTWDY